MLCEEWQPAPLVPEVDEEDKRPDPPVITRCGQLGQIHCALAGYLQLLMQPAASPCLQQQQLAAATQLVCCQPSLLCPQYACCWALRSSLRAQPRCRAALSATRSDQALN